MDRPLSEWTKWYFRIPLGYAAQILNDFEVSINGIPQKNITVFVKNGDIIRISDKEFIVEWDINGF